MPGDFGSDFGSDFGGFFPQPIPTLPPGTVQTPSTPTGVTLLLDIINWDLVLDANNNIAVASAPYALAQDAASAIRLFLGELWYDTTQGVPYFPSILGQSPPLSLIKAKLVAAAMTVPGVSSARVFITNITERGLNGQVQIIDPSTGTVIATAQF